jgi:putative ABC transport system ATP-binding protein
MSKENETVVKAVTLTRSLSMGERQVHILKEVSFQVPGGQWVALTGPSGAGKSTLLGLLAGIDTPTSGQLWIGGHDITKMDEVRLARIRNRNIGIVFQSFHLIPTLTARENVEVPLYVGDRSRQAKRLAQEMLAWVGLSQRVDHRPHQLSGGEQQRVAIARALVTQPTLLLADEPTGNLDSVTGQKILDLFDRLREEFGVTLIVATHDPAAAQRADRELQLLDGRFVRQDDAKGRRANGSSRTGRPQVASMPAEVSSLPKMSDPVRANR